MPKPRKPENKGLPARWRLLHGAYYYAVPPEALAHWDNKQLYRLGKTLPEAYKVWAAKLETVGNIKTVDKLLDRYVLEVVPIKGAKQQADAERYIRRLRKTFGALPLADIKPQLIYQFVDKADAKVSAHRAIALLSHAFTKAVEWGHIDRHPFKGEVRLKGEAPRTRYVEDWEIVECLSLDSKRKKGSVLAIQAYIRIKLLTGMRRGDLLRLQPARDFKDDGIHVEPGKTSTTTRKRIIIEWTDELRAAVEMAKQARPVDISPWLFCTNKGECYFDEEKETATGWDSMWQRFMVDRVLGETKVKERFTEHDLRAKCASDAETLEHARSLLAHADGKLTERVYRRKPEKVRPLR